VRVNIFLKGRNDGALRRPYARSPAGSLAMRGGETPPPPPQKIQGGFTRGTAKLSSLATSPPVFFLFFCGRKAFFPTFRRHDGHIRGGRSPQVIHSYYTENRLTGFSNFGKIKSDRLKLNGSCDFKEWGLAVIHYPPANKKFLLV